MNLTRETSTTANALSFVTDTLVDDAFKAVIADCFDDSDLSVNEHAVILSTASTKIRVETNNTYP